MSNDIRVNARIRSCDCGNDTPSLFQDGKTFQFFIQCNACGAKSSKTYKGVNTCVSQWNMGDVVKPATEGLATAALTADFVIIRAAEAGVFAGNLVLQDDANRKVKLQNAIRIWYWDGAFTLSQLAMEGVSKPEECKFSIPAAEQEIFGVIEILRTTETAEKNIKGVKPWEARK